LGNTWSTASRIEGTVSIAASVVVAAMAVTTDSDHRAGLVWLSSAALVLLAGGVVFTTTFAIGAATAALGLACVIAEVPAAPLAAVLLLVVAEAGLWSTDDRLTFTETTGPRRERLVIVGAIGVASIAIGAALRTLARDVEGGGKIYSVIAGVSVTALAVLISIGVRRLPSRAGSSRSTISGP
jgi:hypothetical protein